MTGITRSPMLSQTAWCLGGDLSRTATVCSIISFSMISVENSHCHTSGCLSQMYRYKVGNICWSQSWAVSSNATSYLIAI